MREGALLVVRYRDHEGDWFTVPGGGQRHRESLEETLVREFAEETGAAVRVGPLRFVREVMEGPHTRRLPPGFHQLELYFACELESEIDLAETCSVPDPHQVCVEWRSLSELRRLAFFPQSLLEAIESGREFGYLGVS
jgi:ADP-ribose pyrophosphatase YjhB (NUDIX family)